MAYSETHEESFTYFDEREEEAIEAWLAERGYSWSSPTLCGSCCGYWVQEYQAYLSEGDITAFNAFAAANNIEAVASTGRIKIA